MKWARHYLLIGIILLQPLWSYAQTKLITEGTVIAYFDSLGKVVDEGAQSQYYRKLLSMEKDRCYWVQDFFTKQNKKQSDPFCLLDNAELTSWTPKQLNGQVIQWYENGLKQIEASYVNGVLDGEVASWFESGQQESQMYFKHNQVDGLMRVWHANGQKESEIYYQQGMLNGISRRWNDKGQQVYVFSYKQGKQHGVTTFWHVSGHKALEEYYVDGRLSGLSTRWDEQGRLISLCSYMGDKLLFPCLYIKSPDAMD